MMPLSAAITVLFTAAYLLTSLFLCRGVRLTTRGLTMTGLACALTVALSLVYIPIPTGASITCGSMLPLMVLAIVYDRRLAILGGWVCGVLALFLLPLWQPVHWGQFLVEHMVCFSCLGYAGLWGSGSRLRILGGAALASAIKVAGHILSGVLFFFQNAWDGWGAWGYSLAYNLSCNIPEAVLSTAVLLALPLPLLEKAVKGGEQP